MKKNINDYKGTETAIEVNSIEEFDKIKKLLGHKQKGSNCFTEKTKYVSCYNDDYANQEWWVNKGFTLYKASDFLEEELESKNNHSDLISKELYVECIKGNNTTKHNQLGKIYKVKDYNQKTGFLQIDDNYIINIYFGEKTLGNNNVTDYKLSTKTAYEAQKQLTEDDLLTNEIYEFDTKKLIIGEIYYRHNFIFDHVSKINYSRNNTAISITEKSFFNENAGLYAYNEKPERLATDEEKKWLNVCIKQDKFIPREDLHLYDDSGLLKIKTLKEQVKEGLNLKNRWLKCIKKCNWKGINIGEYVQIMENNAITPYVTFKKNYKVALSLDRVDSYKEFELMPEGFSPYEFKIGDYLFDSCYKQNLLTSKESFFTETDKMIINGFLNGNGQIFRNNIDSEDIYIIPITKRKKEIQTITIESITNLNLNLKTIKPKQIQTIKI